MACVRGAGRAAAETENLPRVAKKKALPVSRLAGSTRQIPVLHVIATCYMYLHVGTVAAPRFLCRDRHRYQYQYRQQTHQAPWQAGRSEARTSSPTSSQRSPSRPPRPPPPMGQDSSTALQLADIGTKNVGRVIRDRLHNSMIGYQYYPPSNSDHFKALNLADFHKAFRQDT